MLRTIVDHKGGDGKGDMSEQAAWEQEPTSSAVIRKRIAEEVEAILAWLSVRGDRRRFDAVAPSSASSSWRSRCSSWFARSTGSREKSQLPRLRNR